jgi:acyl-CoA synthetase (AMP-forming)/AMP-acid ligase II
MEILARLRRHATDSPDRLAVREIATGRAMTWRELDAAVHDFSGRLNRSAVVMLKCPNRLDFHVAFLTSLAAGVTVFPVPHDIADAEFNSVSAKAGAAAVINPDLSIRSLADTRCESGPALLLQSSGTMGLPKIARREAGKLDAVSANMVEAIGITESDHVLACVPLCHSYGLEHGLLAPIFAGATVHLAQGFDLATIRRELVESSITVFPAVPSIYEMLGNLPDEISSFPLLRMAYSAGGPLPAGVFAKIRDSLGITVGQLYGATEIGSVTFAHPGDPHFDPASVGKPMRDVETQIDADGQLLIRATSMMSGYIGDDSPLNADGFFPTGDLAQIDDHGNLLITGRLKLLIDVGGLKVNPLEVEQTIAQHPAVGACVVVPMRLSETVFRLKAIVTPADERHPPTSEDLRRFVRERLTAYKIPRVFEVRATLPRSATGKILRHLLVESA